MEPISADSGKWLLPLLETHGSDLNVVPRGFPAYARVFHPARRDRPTGEDGGPVTWAEVARVFGKSMHPLAQYHRLAGPEVGERQEVLDSSGWRYSEPEQGNLAAHILEPVATILCRHTTTPDSGVAAVWEGWGGLTGSARYLTAVRGRLPGILGKLTAAHRSGPGPLPTKTMKNSRLSLPGRDHFLFAAAPRSFTDAVWIQDSPWNRDPHWPQSPSLLWPEDRAWVMVTEIDFDSTIVAGSPSLVADLIADQSIEALQINEGADLTQDADNVNRPQT
ncbi:hypothetical protein AB4089_20235 [Arthrobacter sp. 2MCAF15]|uniref:hypothetical protein n=1 Tax=Arthrobacter sp. 2MCAF15 TaxID=3232984 RepID=UPI003F8ED85D